MSIATMPKKAAPKAVERAERKGAKTLEQLEKYHSQLAEILGLSEAVIREMKQLNVSELSIDGVNRGDRALDLLFDFYDDFDMAIRPIRRAQR